MLKSMIFASTVFTVVAFVLAQDAPVTEQSAKARHTLERSGGRVVANPKGPDFVVIDARKTSCGAADMVVNVLKKTFYYNARVENIPLTDKESPFAKGREIIKNGALMVVVIAAGKSEFPALTVFPEERIGVINANVLNEGVSPADGEIRIVKEIWRAFGVLGGASFSTQNGDVMRPISTVKDLDAIPICFLNGRSWLSFNELFDKFGIQQGGEMTYRAAYRLGIAPPPTNDIQRAVIEKIKTKDTERKSKTLAEKPAKAALPAAEAK